MPPQIGETAAGSVFSWAAPPRKEGGVCLFLKGLFGFEGGRRGVDPGPDSPYVLFNIIFIIRSDRSEPLPLRFVYIDPAFLNEVLRPFVHFHTQFVDPALKLPLLQPRPFF